MIDLSLKYHKKDHTIKNLYLYKKRKNIYK